jgi:hypothetical protein
MSMLAYQIRIIVGYLLARDALFGGVLSPATFSAPQTTSLEGYIAINRKPPHPKAQADLSGTARSQ